LKGRHMQPYSVGYSNGLKKIYLKPAWKLPASYATMVDYPPGGYEFIKDNVPEHKFFRFIGRWKFSYSIMHGVDKTFPVILAKSWLQKCRQPPEGTSMIYSHGHLQFVPLPWVVEVEYAHLLLGHDPKHIGNYQGTLENILSAPYCKKIICWSEAGRKTIAQGLNAEKFYQKIVLIHHSVPPKKFVKDEPTGKVKILFVGSLNIKGQFWVKGGGEVMEAFTHLYRSYPNLELIIRSDLPRDVKERYGGRAGIKILDGVLPWEELEREYRSADIFVLPSHNTSPFTILDAMSCELPVVTLDAWANGEIVADGKTGLVVRRSQKTPYYYNNTCHPNYGSDEFEKAVCQIDHAVIAELVKKVSLLIEDPQKRRELGRAARYEIESGRFTIAKRNEKLKQIFDEATAGMCRGF